MLSVQDSTITELLNYGRNVHPEIWCFWDGGAGTDETHNLASFTVTESLAQPGYDMLPAKGAARAQFTLINRNHRFSLFSDQGDTSIKNLISPTKRFFGIKVQINVVVTRSDDTQERIHLFTGWITKFVENQGDNTVSFEAVDVSFMLYQKRASTAVSQNVVSTDYMQSITVDAGVIDPLYASFHDGLAILPYAWLDDESIMQELIAVAAAEGGSVYPVRDQSGVYLTFSNYQRYLKAKKKAEEDYNPAWTEAGFMWRFQAEDEGDLIIRHNPDQLATEIEIKWQPRRETRAAVIYTLNEYKWIPPGETITFDIEFQHPASRVYDLAFRTHDYDKDINNPYSSQEDWELPLTSDYWFENNGTPMNDYCTISMDAKAQRATVTITNNHDSMGATLSFLRVRGVPLVGGKQEKKREETGVIDDFQRTRTISGNPYIQTDHVARLLLSIAREWNKHLVPIYVLQNHIALPFLELGDRVKIETAFHRSDDTWYYGSIHPYVTGIIIGASYSYRRNAAYLSCDYTILDDSIFVDDAIYQWVGSYNIDYNAVAYF